MSENQQPTQRNGPSSWQAPQSTDPHSKPPQNLNTKLAAVAIVLASLALIGVIGVLVLEIRRGDGVLVCPRDEANEGPRRDATTLVLQARRDLRVNDVIREEDLEAAPMRKDAASQLGLVISNEYRSIAIGKVLTKPIQKGQWLTWQHVEAAPGSSANSGRISENMVAFPLQIDPRSAPGAILNPNDHINLLGQFSVGGKTDTLTIIEGVRVLEVNFAARSDDSPLSPARQITVEVSPALVRQLANVLTHARSVRAIVRNPHDKFTDGFPGSGLSDEMKPFATSAAGGSPDVP